MNLSIKPHVSGGHYDTITVPARSSQTVNLWASYDNTPLMMTRCHVMNLRNDGNVSFTLPDGALQSTLPPFVNRDINLPGLQSVTVTNDGTREVVVMFADDKMIGLANDVYATIPSSNIESQFTIVNNFELQSISSIENEGIENGISYTAVGGLTLAANPKFGNRCIYYSDTSGNDTSGLLISKAGLVDMTGDWSLEFFEYGQLINDSALIRLGYDNNVNNGIMIYRRAADAAGSMSANVFGTVTTGVTSGLLANEYNHIAMSKIGSYIKIFVNGGLIFTSAALSAGQLLLILDNIHLGYSNLNLAGYKNFGALIDAFAFHDSLGLYATNFTPRTSAPI